MLGHLGDVVEDDLVGVALDVVGLLVCVEGDGTHDTDVGVIEGSMSSEVGSLLLILVFFCHCAQLEGSSLDSLGDSNYINFKPSEEASPSQN